nr:hypothetical protein Iba_chr03dCG3850 [Ipomoea batatas]
MCFLCFFAGKQLEEGIPPDEPWTSAREERSLHCHAKLSPPSPPCQATATGIAAPRLEPVGDEGTMFVDDVMDDDDEGSAVTSIGKVLKSEPQDEVLLAEPQKRAKVCFSKHFNFSLSLKTIFLRQRDENGVASLLFSCFGGKESSSSSAAKHSSSDKNATAEEQRRGGPVVVDWSSYHRLNRSCSST